MRSFGAVLIFLGLLSFFVTETNGAREITIVYPYLFPESVAYFQENSFLVGSSTQGGVYRVDAKTGFVSPFYASPKRFPSTLGVHVDKRLERIWVTISNISVLQGNVTKGFLAGLIALDFDGNLLFRTDLSEIPTRSVHLANDVVNDFLGNAYVTDSLGSQIWKVNSRGQAQRFVKDSSFSSPSSSPFSLNGIENYKNTYLLTVSTTSGSLLRISLKNPSDIIEVRISPENSSLVGADALQFLPDERLFVCINSPSGFVVLSSSDQWKTAKVVQDVSDQKSAIFNQPSAVALTPNGSIYLLNSYQSKLSSQPSFSRFSLSPVRI